MVRLVFVLLFALLCYLACYGGVGSGVGGGGSDGGPITRRELITLFLQREADEKAALPGPVVCMHRGHRGVA